MDILFKNAKIITVDADNPYIDGGYLAVSGKKIEYVGKERPGGTAKREIDARGKVLMPGLVNAHTHVPMTLFRGLSDDCSLQEWLFDHIFPAEDRLCDERVRLGTELSVAEMLASGTTSFSDSYFFIDALYDAVAKSGIKANISRSIAGNSSECFETKASVIEAKRNIERVKASSDGRVKVDASIHAEYTSDSEYRKKVAEIAKENGLILQIHMSETESEHNACIEKYGKTPAGLFYDEGLFDGTRPLLAHCCYVTDEDMDILKSVGASVAHCPVSNLKLASGVAPVLRMLDKGINVGLGTDGVASNNNMDMFEEIKLFAILHKGISKDPTAISAAEAIYAATRAGALAQERDASGMLKAGFDADIIMLDFNKPHLSPCRNVISNAVYSAHGSDVALTMCEGKVLYESGEFRTLDVERLIYEMSLDKA